MRKEKERKEEKQRNKNKKRKMLIGGVLKGGLLKLKLNRSLSYIK